jgi:hypothetical protein
VPAMVCVRWAGIAGQLQQFAVDGDDSLLGARLGPVVRGARRRDRDKTSSCPGRSPESLREGQRVARAREPAMSPLVPSRPM